MTARGGNWRSVEAGGGSAGSIWMECELLSGDGSIDVRGGDGYPGAHNAHGGGGAGGRMVLYYQFNSFVGKLTFFS